MGEQTNPWDLLQPQDALSRPKYNKKLDKGVLVLKLLLIVWTISSDYIIQITTNK